MASRHRLHYASLKDVLTNTKAATKKSAYGMARGKTRAHQ
jgi:hypothetical protein